MDIRQFQERLTAMLLGWATACIGAGIGFGRREELFYKGVGEQFVGWGLVNGAIAAFGATAAKRRKRLPEADSAATRAAEKRTLARLLWLNTGLDVLYVLGGALLAGRGAPDERRRGRGLGIMIQGGFLFFFDSVNALLLRRVDQGDQSPA